MREIVAACLVFLTTSAYAYRGRPVADLRFDGRSESYVEVLASDGQDFVALLGHRVPYTLQYHVFSQKIVDGRPAGPQHRIASGTPMSLVWTGSHYLALWLDGNAARVGRVSREGSLIAMAPQLSFKATTLFVNDGHVLAVSGATVQPLDANGSPAGPVVTHAVTGPVYGAGPAGDGFALLFLDGSELKLYLLRADGTAILPSPVVAGTTDGYGLSTDIATDGADTLIVLRERHTDTPETLRTFVVGADGAVKSQRTIYSHLGVTVDSMIPDGLVWDGSRYVLALGLQRADGAMDAAMILIGRDGDRIGDVAWIVEKPRSQQPTSLAWNGRELLLAFYTGATSVSDKDVGSYCLTVNPATMTGSAPAPFGRTFGEHDELTIAAGSNGYLAAWFDHGDGLTTTLRASRIDRQGNYLDGEGIVLATMPHPVPYATPTIAIDGDGPQWLVVWATGSIGSQIRARSVSRAGVPGQNTIAIGMGKEADVVWTGSQYVVFRSDGSLYRDTLSAGGAVLSTTLLAQWEEIDDLRSIRYQEPVLTRLGNQTIGVYVKNEITCPPWYVQPTPCHEEMTVMGRRFDADTTPFVIATSVWGDPAVATNGSQALVAWSQYPGLRGAFLSASQPEQPGAPFLIHTQGTHSSIAADGPDFLLVRPGIAMQKISSSGAVSEPAPLRLDGLELPTDPVVAASVTLPPLIGFLHRHTAYDTVPRAALLFPGELDDEGTPPPAPAIVCATKNADDTVTVRWQPMQNILGISIELELSDGTFRQVGVAPPGATSARVTLPGLEGDALRVRAWNAGGLSEGSSIAPSVPPPAATLRSSMRACAGVPATIGISLSGIAPFTVRWSDGLVQSNVASSSATRTVTVTRDTTFTIVSVQDASCAANEVPESVRVTVDPQPAIQDQTRELRIGSGQTATLSVVASDATGYAWFEGARGDTSRPVGGNAARFTTTALTQSTRYWVRVTNRCGSVDSQVMNVTVQGKRRAARR